MGAPTRVTSGTSALGMDAFGFDRLGDGLGLDLNNHDIVRG
jgi:hypothetical protein